VPPNDLYICFISDRSHILSVRCFVTQIKAAKRQAAFIVHAGHLCIDPYSYFCFAAKIRIQHNAVVIPVYICKQQIKLKFCIIASEHKAPLSFFKAQAGINTYVSALFPDVVGDYEFFMF